MDKIVKAIAAQKPPEGGGAKSWWRWPLLVLLVLVGLAVAAWALSRNRRELAKLRHERNKREIERANAQALAEAAQHEEAANAALVRTKELAQAAHELDKQIATAERVYEERRKLVEQITWRDLPRADLERADTDPE